MSVYLPNKIPTKMDKTKFEIAKVLEKEIEAKQEIVSLYKSSLCFSDIDLRANGNQLMRISPEIIKSPQFAVPKGSEYEKHLFNSNADLFEEIRVAIARKAKALEKEIEDLVYEFNQL